MICPDCENGKVFHPLAHVRASKDYGKYTPCPRCDGSGVVYCCDGEDTVLPEDTIQSELADNIAAMNKAIGRTENEFEFDPATGQGDRSGAGQDRPMVEGG